MSALNWYVIRLRPTGRLPDPASKDGKDAKGDRLEFDVLHALTQREHEALVPFERKATTKPGTKLLRWRSYPLFPCYVFGGFQSYDEFRSARDFINGRAEAIGRLPPILCACGYGAKPSVLTPEEVAFLRSHTGAAITETNLHKGLKPGMDVRIVDGPWREQTGKLDSVDRKRIRVMMRMFGAMMPVELPPTTAVEAA